MEPDSPSVGEATIEVLSFLRRLVLLRGERLLTTAHAAEWLDVSPDYVRNLTTLGELRRVNLSGDDQRPVWRYRYTDILEMVNRYDEEPTLRPALHTPRGQKKHQPTAEETHTTY